MTCPQIFIISDGRGETARSVVSSALVQFKGRDHEFQVFGAVRTPAQVHELLTRAAECGATVFYTLVSADMRAALREGAGRLLVPTVDVLGPALSALFDLLKVEPTSRPGLLYDSDREHIDRMTAINYTLQHDDGQHVDDLADAQVVLVGVSRASKSSTSFFLGYHGIRVANVPLIPQVEPPATLTSLDPAMVIGLSINSRRLRTIREVRARYLGPHGTEHYVDERLIVREIRYAHQLMLKHNWRTVDVSYKAIEEVAKEVAMLRGIKLRHPI